MKFTKSINLVAAFSINIFAQNFDPSKCLPQIKLKSVQSNGVFGSMGDDYLDDRNFFPDSVNLMTWQMASRGILSPSQVEDTQPNQESPYQKRPMISQALSMEERWERVVRVSKVEYTIRTLNPDILLLQNLERQESIELATEISRSGYSRTNTVNGFKHNYDTMQNIIFVRNTSNLQVLESFQIEHERQLTDPVGIVIMSDRTATKFVVICNIRLRTSYKESIHAEIMDNFLVNLRAELRARRSNLGFISYSVILAGNFLQGDTSEQLKVVKMNDFVDASFGLILPPKPPTKD